ncbi:MAG: hypothetical protein ACM3SR_09220 [Ignavibacteriales bacterium]
MAKPNMDTWIKLKKASDIAVLSLIIFFLLALSFHNHAFCFDTSSVKKVPQSNSTYPSESNELCPACSLYGNVKLHNTINPLDYSFFRIVVAETAIMELIKRIKGQDKITIHILSHFLKTVVRITDHVIIFI